MNVETAWEWAQITPWRLLALAVLIAVAGVGLWADARVRQPRRGWSFVLRLLLVAWLVPWLLGLHMWRDQTQPQPGRFALLVDRTGSTALRPELDAAIERARDGLQARLQPLGQVEVVQYGGRSAARPWAPAGTTIAAGGPTHMLDDLDQLPGSVLAAGVTRILIGDGADRSLDQRWPSTVPVAAALVPLADLLPSPIVLDGIQSDAYALVRSPLRLSVTLRREAGAAIDDATVRVWNGDIMLGEQLVQFGPAAVTATAVLDVLPTREGYQVFRVEVAGAELDPAPAVHTSRVPVRVIRDRIRVLHVVGRPDWETRLVREVLKRDPTIDLVSFQILRTHGDQPGAQEDELSLIPFPTQELFTTELPKFDVVIYQNFDYQPYFHPQFRAILLRNLRDFVVRDGGGFAMTAGDLSFGFAGYHATPLGSVLPVHWVGRGMWREPAPPTNPGPWSRWFGAAPPSHSGWVDRVYVSDAKPGARVVWQADELPVAVVGTAGAGRTGAVLTDQLWRAANFGGAGDRAAIGNFWSRLVRYLAGDPEFEDVHVTWERLVVPPGGEIVGRALPATGTSHAELVDGRGDVVARVPLHGGQLRAQAPTTDAELWLRVGQHTAPEPLIVQLPLSERTDVSLDPSAWARWADAGDALVVPLDDWDSSALWSRLEQSTRRVIHRDVVPIGSLHLFWIVGVLLVLADLAIRRVSGAP